MRLLGNSYPSSKPPSNRRAAERVLKQGKKVLEHLSVYTLQPVGLIQKLEVTGYRDIA